MIKYIKKNKERSGLLVKFNTETTDIDVLNSYSSNIDWIWIVDEAGEFNGEHVSAGDIIVRMYAIKYDSDDNETFVIKDERLKDHYKRLIEYRESQKHQYVSGEACGDIPVQNETPCEATA